MILNEVMKETADAIREKTGKSDLIAPVNFAEEIKTISVGGGSNSDPLAYIEITDSEYFASYETIKMFNPVCFKISHGGISPASEVGKEYSAAIAFAFAPNIKILSSEGELLSVTDLFELNHLPIDEFLSMTGSRYMTAEEFYGTNQMVSQ